jgi:sialate O-acetylesterase
LILFVFILPSFANGQSVNRSVLKAARIFGDHMVLQQKMQFPVWGTARPQSTVQVVLAGFTATTVTDDDGRWFVRLPSMNAGGPYAMHIMGDQELHFKDVMVGEVWIASGQSNMAWNLGAGVGPETDRVISEAFYPGIRFFNVPLEPFSIPRTDLTGGFWSVCSPLTVRSMSAVAYSFAKELHTTENVPVGVICTHVGATRIESWISEEMLKSFKPYSNSVDRMDRDTIRWNQYLQQSRRNEKIRDSLSLVLQEGVKIKVHLKDYDDSGWNMVDYPMTMVSVNLSRYWGFVWFRKRFDFPFGTTAQDYFVQLPYKCKSLDMYLNGNPVYMVQGEDSKKQVFKIRSEQFNHPDNVLSLRMLVYWGIGELGFEDLPAKLVSADGKHEIPLTGSWKYNAGVEPPIPQRQDYFNHYNVLFNGMVAPVVPYGIRGVIWYQGEQNSGNPRQYRTLFPMLISDWRIRWQQGYFPFLYVQLAGYRPRKASPSPDQWAEIREAQMMALRVPQTGMASAIDLGDTYDIHPLRKIPVGQRLFKAAQKVAYGENVVHMGPVYDTSFTDGSIVRVKFTSSGSGLVSKDGQPLRGFALAGEDKIFHWAQARIDGHDVVVSCPEVPSPVAVRYGWDSNPDVTLYNREGLPASPFRSDDWIGF